MVLKRIHVICDFQRLRCCSVPIVTASPLSLRTGINQWQSRPPQYGSVNEVIERPYVELKDLLERCGVNAPALGREQPCAVKRAASCDELTYEDPVPNVGTGQCIER